MVWIPYRTTITQGDINRNPVDICRVALGKMVNYTAVRYPYITGYTMQHYRSANIVTPQTNAIITTKVNNKLTPDQLSGSNKPRGVNSVINPIY